MELSNIDKKGMRQLVIMVNVLLAKLKKTGERCQDILVSWDDISYRFLINDFHTLSSVVGDIRAVVGESFYYRFLHDEISEQLENLRENVKLMKLSKLLDGEK